MDGCKDWVHCVQFAFYIPILAAGFPLNLAALWQLFFGVPQWSESTVYLLNLVINDCLLLLALPFKIMAYHKPWTLGRFSCSLFESFVYVNMYGSILLSVCISVDRFVALHFPFQRLRSKRKAVFVCVVVWTLVLGFSYPVYDLHLGSGNESFCFQSFSNETWKKQWIVVCVECVFCGSTVVMVLCSISVVKILHDLRKRNPNDPKLRNNKSAKIVLSNLLVFLLCFIPYHVAVLLYFYMKKNSSGPDVINKLHGVSAIQILKPLMPTGLEGSAMAIAALFRGKWGQKGHVLSPKAPPSAPLPHHRVDEDDDDDEEQSNTRVPIRRNSRFYRSMRKKRHAQGHAHEQDSESPTYSPRAPRDSSRSRAAVRSPPTHTQRMVTSGETARENCSHNLNIVKTIAFLYQEYRDSSEQQEIEQRRQRDALPQKSLEEGSGVTTGSGVTAGSGVTVPALQLQLRNSSRSLTLWQNLEAVQKSGLLHTLSQREVILQEENPVFRESMAILENQPKVRGLSFTSFLILPFQRITRLKLLVQNILKKVEENSQRERNAIKAHQELERSVPVISHSRWLLKKGEVLQMSGPKSTRTMRSRKLYHPLYLFLFNNLLLITKRSSRTEDMEDQGQVQCIQSYSAQEPDELSVEMADILLVLEETNDGWMMAERLHDGERGWFPCRVVEDIKSAEIRAQNLRECERIQQAQGGGGASRGRWTTKNTSYTPTWTDQSEQEY
ncbi:Ephexin-1 [Bagarius yarrelli]|uniref:Ephexin-1 n=1 Tax=Bagarius yarrelli TaxID=175774 RepID=A0A556TI94_BAGYA|nr:Ephexin-1 [Bagarius yarrelli]